MINESITVPSFTSQKLMYDKYWVAPLWKHYLERNSLEPIIVLKSFPHEDVWNLTIHYLLFKEFSSRPWQSYSFINCFLFYLWLEVPNFSNPTMKLRENYRVALSLYPSSSERRETNHFSETDPNRRKNKKFFPRLGRWVVHGEIQPWLTVNR